MQLSEARKGIVLPADLSQAVFERFVRDLDDALVDVELLAEPEVLVTNENGHHRLKALVAVNKYGTGFTVESFAPNYFGTKNEWVGSHLHTSSVEEVTGLLRMLQDFLQQ